MQTARRLLSALRRLLHNEQLVLLVLAVIVGALASCGAIAFRYLVLAIQGISYGTFSETLYTHVQSLPAWQILLVPTAGGLLIGLFVHYFMPGRRPHAVAEVIEAVALRSGRVSLRIGLASAAVSAASLGVGASVGREGPVVHLGAAICSHISRKLGFGRSLTINLVGCGVASAVAASFNAPIAGTFFALEVIIGHYGITAFAPIVLASVTGTVISRAQFGDFPAFIIPGHALVSPLEFPAFALLGVVGAVAAIVLMRAIGTAERWAKRIPARMFHPMIGGLLVGVIALVFPHVLGVGYGTTDAALREQLGLYLLLALIAAKTTAVAISFGSGFGGGMFSPSLFLGATVGSAFGIIATSAFPDFSSGYSAYTLVGMGAVAGAVMGAPISTILIVFEMTGDYAITVAVMVAVVIASVITHQLFGRSFFSWQLEDRGINLVGGRETGLLAGTTVGDVMKADYAAVTPSTPLADLRERLQTAPCGTVFVVQDDGVLLGTVSLADMSEAAFDTSLDTLLNAADVARPRPLMLALADGLGSALKLMESAHEEHVAVVEDIDTRKMIGIVHQVDVILAYNRALLRVHREEHGLL